MHTRKAYIIYTVLFIIFLFLDYLLGRTLSLEMEFDPFAGEIFPITSILLWLYIVMLGVDYLFFKGSLRNRLNGDGGIVSVYMSKDLSAEIKEKIKEIGFREEQKGKNKTRYYKRGKNFFKDRVMVLTEDEGLLKLKTTEALSKHFEPFIPRYRSN